MDWNRMGMSGTPDKPIEVQRCDSCELEAWGYTEADAKKAGWVWHKAGKVGTFVCCAECEAHYAERRAQAA